MANIKDKINPHLLNRLEPVKRRWRLVRIFECLTICWLLLAGLTVVCFWLNWSGHSHAPWLAWVVTALGAAAAVGIITYYLLKRWSLQAMSGQVEQRYEELDSSLKTAIEQHPDAESGQLSFLQQEVIRQAVYHSYRQPWQQAIPTWRVALAPLAAFSAAGLLVAALLSYAFFAKPIPSDDSVLDFNQVAIGSQQFQLSVEPGDADVEKGSSLLVLAKFGERLPPEVSLVFTAPQPGEDAAAESSIPLQRSLADPVFGGRIGNIQQPLQYHLEYAGQASETFSVNVFEYPQLIRHDAELTYPEYTELEPRLIQDVRRLTAVEGTEVQFRCYLNKAVASAELVSEDGQRIRLQPGNESNLYIASQTVTQSRKYRLELADDRQRHNQLPPTISITAQRNTPPDLKLVQPARDLQVSPIEEIELLAKAWDDFGVRRIGLGYSIGASDVQDIVLGEQLPPKTQNEIPHLLQLELLEAEADDLVSYYFWAEDVSSNQVVRRTTSDIFFAEVRRFEEIFRQGQAPPGGAKQPPPESEQSDPGNSQAGELADLQKQIITATWNVMRRESEKVSDQFTENVGIIVDSQQSARDQLEQLASANPDPDAQRSVQQIDSVMKTALDHLKSAQADSDVHQLKPAFSAEQRAYQQLLKLRSSERQVVQSEQPMRQQGGQPNSRSQQQLQQLQLEEDINRYESERLAQPGEDPAAREDRQVLNRLRELARRQADLNDRIKELQSALDQAKDEQERAEIQRELKRLEEEQQKILRDADELQERMQSEQNQQRMSEQAQQLQQARENARRSSEALQQTELTQAAAAGSRAEQEFDQLRDEFQQRTANQFSEEMREMRQSARDLAEAQDRTAAELRNLDQPPQDTNSLGDSDRRQDLIDELEQQGADLEQLRENMRQLVEDAEELQPLLAEELYDTYRQSEQDQIGEALESAQFSLQSGFDEDARDEQQRAREGIERIREGVDRAAERVLGDEAEALRRANRQLEQLRSELQTELREAGGLNSDEPNQDGKAPNAGVPDQRDPDRDPTRLQSTEADPDSTDQSPDQSDRDPADGNRESDQDPPGEGQPPGEDQRGRGGDSGSETPRPDSEAAEPNRQQQSEPTESMEPGANAGQRDPNNRPGQRSNSERPDRSRGTLFDELDRQPTPADASGFGADPRDPLPRPNNRPLTGEDFLEWSDRLRDVEEMLADPEMRAEAARIRENARDIRKEYKRRSQDPNWDLVKQRVAQPLVNLQRRITDELIRKTAEDQVVPLDRDPVPTRYESAVRKYYEQLGTGR